MKPETLDGLMIDRELGELPADVGELLDSYLQLAPAMRLQAEAMNRTLCTAREAVRQFPELACGTGIPSSPHVIPLPRRLAPWISRAAMLAAAVTMGGFVGYRTGTNSLSRETERVAEIRAVERNTAHQAPRQEHLWARYQVAFDGQRGTFSVGLQPQ